MKVLHVISGMDPKAGGVTTAVNTIIDGLNMLNVFSEVACLDDPNESFIHNTPFIHGLGPSKTAWRYSPQLQPWLNENLSRFDIIIVHGLWQYQVHAVYRSWRGIKGIRPKLLVMPHGMLDPYFQKAEGRKFKAIRNWLFWKFVEGPVINHADGLLFTCETEKILSYKSFSPYHPKRADIPGLGIPPPAEPTGSMERGFFLKTGDVDVNGCLLYISRIHQKKGIDLLINAYRELKQNMPLPKLVIAGPGLETDFGKAMQSLAGDTNDILFTGMLRGDEKWGAFHACAAMILPSHQENFGFVVVEALACGKPVLISNQVNIWREVHAGGGGIVEDDTVEGAKRLLSSWMALSAEQKSEMRIKAKATFEEYFSLTAASAKLYSILDDVCRS